MTDTQPLAPTDDEIVALADATRTAEGGANGYILPISFTRAVLAKWGAQPVACEPLTTSQIRDWWASDNGLEDCDMCKLTDFLRVVRAVEEKHGIKGGQHGTE